ncbi:hypothetical protein MSG28_015749 [Choristoneura fumiferana]|uniref:Uncharacterized protein n=2 Tax=Choristoneura fumiferana TaxID=7141 RepID=A0ACC0KBD3_CHOFU|nr:hypothetical protein MSG28_015749 [Choristoneura fumiferana]
MQTNKERNGRPSKNHPLKRLKSVTRYPSKEPSFIIAFALQETYDNLATEQQKICCSKNSKASDHTITPKVSTSNYSTGEMGENQSDSVVPETSLNYAGCDRDEGGDLEQKLPSLEECIMIKKIENPEMVFGRSSHRKSLKQRTSNKQNKCKDLNKVKVVYNKRKGSKRLDKKLCKYFGEKHMNVNTISNKIQSESISKMLSRSRILEKVSAKENLIEDQHIKGMSNQDSASASFITANESFFSYISQDTLTYKESNNSVKDTECDLSKSESMNSVIRILPDETFKTVINVSRAVIQSGTFAVEHNIRTMPSNTVIMHQNLTSTETFIEPVPLTSDPVSEVSSKAICDNYMDLTVSDISTERFEGDSRLSTTEASDEEYTFYNAKTSSYFNKCDNDSISENAVQIERPDELFQDTFAKADPCATNSSLIDRVINLGIFPEIISHNSNHYPNDDIVTEKISHNYTYPKDEDTTAYDQNNVNRMIPNNITQKSFCPELNVSFIKPKTDLNLVNEAAITDILQGKGKHENVKRTEELSNNYPSNLSELWEKLLIALDSTAKKIEESLSERIIQEMRDTFKMLNKANAKKDVEAGFVPTAPTVNNAGDTDEPMKEVCPEDAPSKLEQGLQCNLVQSQLIDELMLFKNRSVSGRICPAVSHQSSSKFIEHSFEVLKPPGVMNIPNRGDVVTLTDEETVEGPSAKVLHIQHPTFLKISVIWKFLKENVFVLTSVPVFFFVFILFYLFVLLIAQPL